MTGWLEYAALPTAIGAIIGLALALKKERRDTGNNAVTKKECNQCKEEDQAFRKRIGKQVDEVEKATIVFTKQTNDEFEVGQRRFARIEKCLVFLVEKQETGAAARMGLYDL